MDGHWTPIMVAFVNNNKDVVELLLNNSADLSITNADFKTVVDIAKSQSRYEELLSTFKNVIINKINNKIDKLNLESALQLISQFKREDKETISIIEKAVEAFMDYYNQLEEYSLFNLELAISRLKIPLLFDYDAQLKQNFKKLNLLKEIILYVARSSNVLTNEK